LTHKKAGFLFIKPLFFVQKMVLFGIKSGYKGIKMVSKLLKLGQKWYFVGHRGKMRRKMDAKRYNSRIG